MSDLRVSSAKIADIVYRCATDNISYDSGKKINADSARACVHDSSISPDEKSRAISAINMVIDLGNYSPISGIMQAINTYLAQ